MADARIVLIEDNPVFAGLVTAFLERVQPRDFTIAGTARTGESGLAAVARLQPAAVVVDLALPDMSGLHVIARLRRAAPDIAIVALTSADPDAFRAPVLAAGADAFVPKERMHVDLLPALHGAVRARITSTPSGASVDA